MRFSKFYLNLGFVEKVMLHNGAPGLLFCFSQDLLLDSNMLHVTFQSNMLQFKIGFLFLAFL